MRFLNRMGYDIDFLPVNKSGVVTTKILESHLKSDTLLVSIMMANNEIGTIQPIKELAVVTHKHNCLFHTDAVQSVGHIVIDVKSMDVDSFMAAYRSKAGELVRKMLLGLLVWQKH